MADTLKLNGVEQSGLIQVISTNFFEQRKYSDGRLITYIWFNVSSRDGANTATHCSYKVINYTIPYKKVNMNLSSIVNTKDVGYYGNVPSDMCENSNTRVVCRAFVTEAFADMWYQGIVIGVWK